MKRMIENKDREILRELAKKQLELANQETNQERIAQWYSHNGLKGDRPMIHLETWTFQQEVIAPRQRCKGEYAREIESMLYQNFTNQELLDDDRVTPNYFGMNYDTQFKLFDIDVQVEHLQSESGGEGLGHHFVPVIEDLEDDYEKLKKTSFSVDLKSTREKLDVVTECFGDILPVRLKMDCLYSVPTQMIVHFMSMEQMMFNMYDYPELFKEMMDRIADDTMSYYRMLESEKMILPTTGFESVGQGSWAFNEELPKDVTRPLTTKDVWGFMDSQETVGISPDMYEEFIFPCYQKISQQYGLLSYGCCEPVDPIWERCISKLSNLRKVSISPWCNEEYMGEQLKNRDIIYHRKPSPNFLGVDRILDEDAFRSHIRKSLLAARGCKMEITQRDVYTIHHDIGKARRYVEIIRDEIDKNWK